MGQYFLLANLTKKEFIHPHAMECGMKLWEICANTGPANALCFLLRQSSEGGGGDVHYQYEYAGRWAGDKIAVIGDYDKSKQAKQLWGKCRAKWSDITSEVWKEFQHFIKH